MLFHRYIHCKEDSSFRSRIKKKQNIGVDQRLLKGCKESVHTIEEQNKEAMSNGTGHYFDLTVPSKTCYLDSRDI